jgi:hypothetical protein
MTNRRTLTGERRDRCGPRPAVSMRMPDCCVLYPCDAAVVWARAGRRTLCHRVEASLSDDAKQRCRRRHNSAVALRKAIVSGPSQALLLPPNLECSAAGVPRSLLSSCRLAARHRNGDEAIAAICRGRRRGRRSLSPRSARQRGGHPRLDAGAQACNANRMHMHAPPGQPPLARAASGDVWASEREVMQPGAGPRGALAREAAAQPSMAWMRRRSRGDSKRPEVAVGRGCAVVLGLWSVAVAENGLGFGAVWLLDYGVVRRPALAGITGGRRP